MLRPYGEFVISSAQREIFLLCPRLRAGKKPRERFLLSVEMTKGSLFFASFAVKFFFSLVARVPAETFSATSLLSFDP